MNLVPGFNSLFVFIFIFVMDLCAPARQWTNTFLPALISPVMKDTMGDKNFSKSTFKFGQNRHNLLSPN